MLYPVLLPYHILSSPKASFNECKLLTTFVSHVLRNTPPYFLDRSYDRTIYQSTLLKALAGLLKDDAGHVNKGTITVSRRVISF